MERFLKFFSLERILTTICDPATHREEAALLAVTIIAILLIFLMIVLFIVVVGEVRRRMRIRGIGVRITKKALLIGALILIGLGIIFSFSSLIYSSYPSFCRYCHNREYRSWRYSSHEKFGCASCHQNPGPIGLLTEKMETYQMAFLKTTGAYFKPIRTDVANARCKKCHVQMKKIIVSGGIRMSHAQPESAGYWCTDCHNIVPHGEKVVPFKNLPTMDKCVKCHNEKRASADCLLCHSEDVGEKRTTSIANYPKVQLPRVTTCRGCHDIDAEGCTSCHGVEMPHPPEWMRKLTHARAAAFERKEACFKCHDSSMFFCNRCHKFPGHAPEWKQLHGAGGFAMESSCMACHTPEMSPIFCGLCH